MDISSLLAAQRTKLGFIDKYFGFLIHHPAHWLARFTARSLSHLGRQG
jgi:hypothetical protein